MKHLLPDFGELSLEEQVAQLLIVRVSGHLFDHQISERHQEPTWAVLKSWLQEHAIGGVLIAGGSAGEVALRTQELQDVAKIPLLIAADVEAGVGQRFSGATDFPPVMALGGIARRDGFQARDYAYQMGQYTAQEAEAIGVNWLLAPVVDVNTNPLNPIINTRAFGDTPEIVSELAIAFIKGAQNHAVLTTAKHFPGHGDTNVDSHLELPTLAHDRERLDTIELAPFQAAIAAQVDSVMTGHLQIPALDKLYPATLSDRVVTKLLRQELGFDGLIVTDALVMKAIADHYDPYEAAILALEAGNDMLMMPADPVGTIEAICQAVEEGRIPADQIQTSVERVWRAKERVTTFGIDPDLHQHAWEAQMPSPIKLEAISQPSVRQTAEAIFTASNHIRGEIPSIEAPKQCVIINHVGGHLSSQSPCIALPQSLGYDIQIVDQYSPPSYEVHASTPTILQLFIPYHAQEEKALRWKDELLMLLQNQTLQGLMIYGNHNLFEQCVNLLPSSLPYGFSYGCSSQAQEILLIKLFALNR